MFFETVAQIVKNPPFANEPESLSDSLKSPHRLGLVDQFATGNLAMHRPNCEQQRRNCLARIGHVTLAEPKAGRLRLPLLIYNALFCIGFVLLSPYYLWRMRRRGGYAKDFGQRFGVVRPAIQKALSPGGAIWIHSVSVGETQAVKLLVERLRALWPDATLVWSTTTSTGYAEIEKAKIPGAIPFYYPLDFPWVVRRVIDLIRPRALILVESEIWPNLMRTLAGRQIPVALINARISPRSYRRYLRLGEFARRIFGRFDLVLAQNGADLDRLAALGIRRDRLHAVGSLKFDAAIPRATNRAGALEPEEIRAKLGVAPTAPIVVGGSTWPGEEAVLIDLWKELRAEFPDLFLVLVPRHAERAAEVVQLASQREIRLALRTQLDRWPTGAKADCLLVNTTGELPRMYELATVVFVGKSLFVVEKSLQNPIEPAALAKPVIVGPNIESFQAIVRRFLAAEAMVQVGDAAALREEIRWLLRDTAARERIGSKAKEIVEQNRGAVERTVALLGSHVLGRPPTLPAVAGLQK